MLAVVRNKCPLVPLDIQRFLWKESPSTMVLFRRHGGPTFWDWTLHRDRRGAGEVVIANEDRNCAVLFGNGLESLAGLLNMLYAKLFGVPVLSGVDLVQSRADVRVIVCNRYSARSSSPVQHAAR